MRAIITSINLSSRTISRAPFTFNFFVFIFFSDIKIFDLIDRPFIRLEFRDIIINNCWLKMFIAWVISMWNEKKFVFIFSWDIEKKLKSCTNSHICRKQFFLYNYFSFEFPVLEYSQHKNCFSWLLCGFNMARTCIRITTFVFDFKHESLLTA